MGTSSSAAELAGKLGNFAGQINGANREGVREAAIVGKAILIGELPTRKLRNVGKSGAKLGATFTNPTSSTNPQSILKYTGPVHFLKGTRRHLIGPKGWRRGRAASNRGLKFTGGDGEIRRGVVEHPGTGGNSSFSWESAWAKVAAQAPKQIQMAQHRALLKFFG